MKESGGRKRRNVRIKENKQQEKRDEKETKKGKITDRLRLSGMRRIEC
jgi:hypothetical protein